MTDPPRRMVGLREEGRQGQKGKEKRDQRKEIVKSGTTEDTEKPEGTERLR